MLFCVFSISISLIEGKINRKKDLTMLCCSYFMFLFEKG
jgi:hypothetical protein